MQCIENSSGSSNTRWNIPKREIRDSHSEQKECDVQRHKNMEDHKRFEERQEIPHS